MSEEEENLIRVWLQASEALVMADEDHDVAQRAATTAMNKFNEAKRVEAAAWEKLAMHRDHNLLP